jgi:hypothetical protein
VLTVLYYIILYCIMGGAIISVTGCVAANRHHSLLQIHIDVGASSSHRRSPIDCDTLSMSESIPCQRAARLPASIVSRSSVVLTAQTSRLSLQALHPLPQAVHLLDELILVCLPLVHSESQRIAQVLLVQTRLLLGLHGHRQAAGFALRLHLWS